MLFNSKEFLIFLPLVFVLYWILSNKNLKIQNSLILLVHIFMDGGIIDFFINNTMTFVDYFIGLKIFYQKTKSQKFYLLISDI